MNVLDQINNQAFEAMTESDDLLQADFVYGGRNEENGDEWGSTYFPTAGQHQKWEFNFSRAQLEDIAAGRLDTVELFICADPACGNRFWSEESGCFHCDYD